MVRNCWGQIHKKVTQNHIYLQEELHHQLHCYQYHNFRIFFQVVLEDSRLHLCYLWRSISKTVTHDIKLEYSSYTLSEPNQTSKMEPFCKNRSQISVVNNFQKKFNLQCHSRTWKRLCMQTLKEKILKVSCLF